MALGRKPVDSLSNLKLTLYCNHRHRHSNTVKNFERFSSGIQTSIILTELLIFEPVVLIGQLTHKILYLTAVTVYYIYIFVNKTAINCQFP